MFMLILAFTLLLAYLCVEVTKLILKNYEAHKFFQIRSPELPVVPEPNIFLGNIDQTIWSMKNFAVIDKWHNQLGNNYGHYFGSQPWLSTKDIDLIKKIELDEALKHLDRTSFNLPSHETNTSIFQINGHEWRRVRKAIAPTLTNMRVRSDEVSLDIEQVIEKYVESMERKLDIAERSTNKRSIILNAHNCAQRITLAVIFSVTYKKDNEIDFDAPEDNWTRNFERAEKLFLNPITKVTWALPFICPFTTWVIRYHPVGRMGARITTYIKQTVDVRQVSDEIQARAQRRKVSRNGAEDSSSGALKSRATPRRRLIDGIIDALMEGKINLEQFVGSAHFLLLAGFETTAATATCILWLLAKNLDIQTKLRETIIKEGIDADYVVWCIMETIRYHPAVPLGVGRVISEDITTKDGLLIPAGTFVMPSIYSIHHDESIWPDHDKFMPERWRHQSEFHPAAFMGFGLGPRNCVGSKLAIHELKLILKAILTKYRIDECECTPDKYNFNSPGLVYTIPEEPVMLRFTALDGQELKDV